MFNDDSKSAAVCSYDILALNLRQLCSKCGLILVLGFTPNIFACFPLIFNTPNVLMSFLVLPVVVSVDFLKKAAISGLTCCWICP
jgi:hypothetical protein